MSKKLSCVMTLGSVNLQRLHNARWHAETLNSPSVYSTTLVPLDVSRISAKVGTFSIRFTLTESTNNSFEPRRKLLPIVETKME